MWEKGLVHTDCTCAHLYPESGYIVDFHKISSKLSIYDYVILPCLLTYGQQTHDMSSEGLFEVKMARGKL